MAFRKYDRIVVGGGIFGTYSSIVLARMGYEVLLIEQSEKLMSRASFVNQARLHTGLHYPRSMYTALEALEYYEIFRKTFPSAVSDFKQIYAISKFNSKTSAHDFELFARRLGVEFNLVNPDLYFNKGTISAAFLVNEPTFDIGELRKLLTSEINRYTNIDVKFSTAVVGGETSASLIKLLLDNGDEVKASGIVIATYASINPLRQMLGLDALSLSFEISEVILGKVSSSLRDTGLTVMDGPFWSIMPFGRTGKSSLTSVGMTPLAKSKNLPLFQCQTKRKSCTPIRLDDCNTCSVRPPSGLIHQIQQMNLFIKEKSGFIPSESLFAVKTILTSAEIDDARPTLVYKEPELGIWTIFSGKISTMFDLEASLA